MKVIEVKNLSHRYDKQPILEDVSFDVFQGDFLAIIGPNGGGKSTLLKLLLNIIKTKSGVIKIFDNQIFDSLNKIGYVPQNTNVNTDFPIKVIEVVMMGHISEKKPFFGYAKEEISCALGALEQVGMKEFAQHKIGSLSGGQRQRVMIARALCGHPQILLLDEPTANIDPSGQKQIYELLKILNKTITIIVVSHDISVILEYANKVAHINKKMVFHNLQNNKNSFITKDDHFCEVELLQMMSKLS